MADMNKLLNRSLRLFIIYAAVVVIVSVPVYYVIISNLWQYELNEHHIILSDAAGREDTVMIIRAVTMVSVVFFGLMLAGFILINRYVSGRLWKPFYKSLEKIKAFRLDQQKPVKFDQPDIFEFAELNRTLDSLIKGNIASYIQQKEFAENASHELQTPLAIMQSKLELLLQSNPLEHQQYEIIEDSLQALARVSRVNKNLLLLTKIENSQYPGKEPVNVSTLINELVLLFDNFREDKGIQIIESVQQNVIVEGNRILIEILLTNLLTNAIRYSPPGSSIYLELTPDQLSIKNEGFTTLNADKVFKRFGAGSSESPGTGLGLALVKQICERYGWKTSYNYSDLHHIFSVEFQHSF
jgi:signal transduction histidine kinase